MSKQRNPLSKRLQRHNRIATLFRSPDPQSVETNLSARFENRATTNGKEIPPGTVKAGLVPPGSPLPQGYLLARPIPPEKPIQTLANTDSSPTKPEIERLPEFSALPPLPQSAEAGAPKSVTSTSATSSPVSKVSAPASSPVQIQRQTLGETEPPPSPPVSAHAVQPMIRQPQPFRAIDEPKKEDSKFSQSQLDRLQAIFDIHKNPENPSSGELSSTTVMAAATPPFGASQPANAKGNLQRTPSEEPVYSESLPPAPVDMDRIKTEPSPDQPQTIQPSNPSAEASRANLPASPIISPAAHKSANPILPPIQSDLNAVVQPIPAPAQTDMERIDQTPPLSLESGRSNVAGPSRGLPLPPDSTPIPSLAAGQIQRLPDHPAENTDISFANEEAEKSASKTTVPPTGSLTKETIHDDAETTQIQPLQEVWAVERRSSNSPSKTKQPSAEPFLAPVIPPTVQKILQETAPGQPTDSRVETLTPRMPRPEVTARPAQVPVLQRTTEEIEPQPVEMVDSAVGPLPSDLWKLIGTQPPSPHPSARVQPATLETKTTPPAEKPSRILPSPEAQEISLSSSQGVVPVAQTRTSQPQAGRTSGAIQREPETTSNEGSGSSAIVQSSEQAGDQPTKPPELDLEDLSIKVYAEVKRRLSVEWERLRNRF